jgi:hypothetical protein
MENNINVTNNYKGMILLVQVLQSNLYLEVTLGMKKKWLRGHAWYEEKVAF